MTNQLGDVAARQNQLWNGVLGEIWSRRQDQFDAVLAPVGKAAIDRASIKGGDRAIDVGCGCGGTTAQLLKLVEPGGAVLGIDISEPMLAEARRRIGPGRPAKFVTADAATFEFPQAHYDVLFSRVGVLFFADPPSAFANMRRALRSGGRVALACNRSPPENPYLTVPLEAAHRHLPPLPPLAPGAPGVFAFADRNRPRAILEQAGFRNIDVSAVDLDLDIGAGQGVDAAVAISMELGPTGNVLIGKSDDQRRAVADTMRSALIPYQSGEKVLPKAGLWIVTAQNS